VQKGHEVMLAPGTKARTLLGKETVLINSGHHQAVKSAGNEIIISGATRGGITEIIEHTAPEYFCFGIQGHPEAQEQGECELFFPAFAEAARSFGDRG